MLSAFKTVAKVSLFWICVMVCGGTAAFLILFGIMYWFFGVSLF